MADFKKLIITGPILSLILFTASSWAAPLSLTLDDFIQIALKNNPEIEIAAQQYSGNKGVLTQSRSLYYPRLSAGADIGRYRVEDLEPRRGGQCRPWPPEGHPAYL